MSVAVPPGWEEASLSSICRVVSGATPTTGVKQYWDGPIPWITPADMSRDRSQVLASGARSLTQEGYDSCSATLVPAGSVVVSSRAPIGYVAIAGGELCTNQGCKSAVPPEFIDSRYLYWFLVAAKPDLEARASGTTFKEISAKAFGATRLWWPPLDDQRRIVEILEDHLSRIDVGTRSLDSAIKRGALLELAALDALAPAGSPVVSMKDLATASGYGTSTKCVVGGPGVPVARIPNVVAGAIDMTDEKRVADPSVDLSNLMLEEGDVLFVRTNGSRDLIGRTAVVQEGVEASFASYLIRYQVNRSLVEPSWVHMMMRRGSARAEIERLASSSAGQHNLSLGKIDRLEVPLPELAVQRTLASQYAVSVDGPRRLVAEAERAKLRERALRRSLLAAAFSGKLTGAESDIERVEEMADV